MATITHITELRVAVRSPTRLYDLDTSKFSISSINENITYTADQLDEKRENRRIYDYMCRLLEVRNWIAECLQMENIPGITDLETDLSNGVLLAQIGNFIDPNIVPVGKIVDINREHYNKLGLMYRHTDNIMLWRRAVESIRFPEVFIPETSDIYEGRNVRTIFCIYALAIHLFRLRRAPPIRSQAYNAVFSPQAVEEMRERLKDSTIPTFSDVSGELSKTPAAEAEKAVNLRFKESLRDPDLLLAFLKSPEVALLYVDDSLIIPYHEALTNLQSTQRDGAEPSVSQIQNVIISVNEKQGLQKLETLLQKSPEFDLAEIVTVLYNLRIEEIMEHAKSLYAEELFKKRQSLGAPLRTAEIEDVIEAVNFCIRVKFCVMDNDAERLYELLNNSHTSFAEKLNEDLKSEYLAVFREAYAGKDKNFILGTGEIEKLVENAGNTLWLRRACETNDEVLLEKAVGDVDGFKKNYAAAYMVAMKKLNNYDLTKAAETIQKRIIKKENSLVEEEQKKQSEETEAAKKKEEAAARIQPHSPNPSLRVVRKFVPHLIPSKEDAEKEAEISENKSRVTKLMHVNHRLNDAIRELDNKIGLVVKNRQSLEELMEHREKVMKATADESITKKTSFRKRDQDQWNGFEVVIYHLQTQPEYLTRLIRNYKEKEEVVTDLIRRPILPIFNYAVEEREEFLFISLVHQIIREEISTLAKPNGLGKSFAVTVTKLLKRLLVEKAVFNPNIAELRRELGKKENAIDVFNLDAEDIFESKMQHKPKDVKEAAENEEVKKILEKSKEYLSRWAIRFAEVVFAVDLPIPSVCITLAIAGWIYKSCYEEQIIIGQPDGTKSPLAEETKKMLAAISKIIIFGTANVGYGKDKWYLTSLNTTIKQVNGYALTFFKKLIKGEAQYQRDKYSDILSKHQPTLHISLQHLNVLHRNLKENIDTIFMASDAPLKNLVTQLSPPSADQELYVTLHLHPLSANLKSAEEEAEERFEKTKKGIVECLLCHCPGEDVPAMLESDVTVKQEDEFKRLPHADASTSNLTQQKDRIAANLKVLEGAKLVTKENKYQRMVNEIAKDINREQRYRKEREEQLARLRDAIVQLEEQKEEYNKTMEAYNEYLKKCLENLCLTVRRPSIKPDSVRASKIIAQRKSLDAVQKCKFATEKLDKKGILLSIDGTDSLKESVPLISSQKSHILFPESTDSTNPPSSERIRRYNKAIFEIATTNRPGILSLTVHDQKRPNTACEINFQELLEAKYREEEKIKYAEKFNFDVNNLIALLNTKFYLK
ncbi:unnamed protein product [Enterobius vermicularis]|uniref:Calponin-homology (CH) domain-containing protein n=1 Tax=Enterobius vermicularis TaxID=51028 RepID=A0A158Q9T5_ENTVE|nr:unnamed protein product [Enterobius vermicularis]